MRRQRVFSAVGKDECVKPPSRYPLNRSGVMAIPESHRFLAKAPRSTPPGPVGACISEKIRASGNSYVHRHRRVSRNGQRDMCVAGKFCPARGQSGQVSVFLRDPDRNVIELRGREQGAVERVSRYVP
jgi:hypothetical protein